MNEVAVWILELVVGGTPYRWGSVELELEDADGLTVRVSGGLELDEVELGEEDVGVSVVDPAVDWASFARWLDGSPARISRWEIGTPWETRDVYSAGVVSNVTHGSREEPVGFDVAKPEGTVESVGRKVPDLLSVITQETWSTAASTGPDLGFVYPTIFGQPGALSDTVAVPVVPVPVPRYAGSFLLLLVSLDRDENIAAASLRVRENELGTESTLPFGTGNWEVKDFVERPIMTIEVPPLDPTFMGAYDASHDYYVGFFDGDGFNQRRDMFSAIVYLLERYGVETVDWASLRSFEAELSVYQVDSWIDERQDSPWEIIEAWLERLPFEIRTGPDGRYFERLRYTPDGTRIVRNVEVGRDATRATQRAFSPGVVSQHMARFRPGRESGQWLATVIVTGNENFPAPPSLVDLLGFGYTLGATTRNSFVDLVLDGRCERAFARYGERIAEVIDLDWTWDVGTALAVLDWMVERDSVDHWVCDYWVENGHDLRVGDEVVITDSEFGLESVTALVMSPPVANRTAWARVQLRYLA